MELRSLNVKPLLFLLGTLLLLALSFGFSSKVSAHGYVQAPESRALLCQKGVNKDCGAIVYEPQSLEAPGNFPEAGAADGKIASANGAFPELDQQSADRWAKVPMKSGANTFTWKLTAAHATDKWDYYITKADWDPNKPLTRADLELFCTVEDGGKRPDSITTHNCEVPERTGYHVILAYWEVYDTANAFYNVIDANFDGDFVEPNPDPDPEPNPDPDPEPNPGDVAEWNANNVYLSGDQVSHNGAIYEAKWWTQGEEPGTSQAWALVEGDTNGGDDGETNLATWNASKVYLQGDLVTFNDIIYRALWWTQGEEPGSNSVWVLN